MKKLIAVLCSIVLIISLLTISVSGTQLNYGEKIEITQHIFKGKINNISFEAAILRTEAELQEFLTICSDEQEFIGFAESLEDGYFDTKGLIIFYHYGEADAQYNIESIFCDDYTLTISYDYYSGNSQEKTDYIIVAEANIADLENAKQTTLIINKNPKETIEFKGHILHGEPKNFVFGTFYGKGEAPIVITSNEEFSAFCETLGYSYGYSNDFHSFAESLGEDYFQEKALLLIYAWSPTTTVYYDVRNVYLDNGKMVVEYVYDSTTALCDAIQTDYITIEINKSDLEAADEISTAIKFMKKVNTKSYTTPSVLRGDIDGDNRITASDYFAVKSLCFGRFEEQFTDISFPRGFDLKADINCDGRITAIDYLMLKRACIGFIEIPDKYVD